MKNFNKYIRILGLFLVLFSISTNAHGQDERERKARKELDDKKTTSQDELRKELIERHREGQSKETLKRMKRSKREAERRKKGKNPHPWWERMFRSNQRKKKRRKRS